jgi:polysaccharide export outer membrane protein
LLLPATAATTGQNTPQPADQEEFAPEETLLTATPLPTRARGAVVGLQDLLEIKVFQLDQFDQTQRVADDGSITLPLLGRVEVAGLTREQVEARIASLLEARYLNDPQVTVFVKEHESRKVAVTGAVNEPGSYEMLGERTVLEMIALAGGVTKDVSKEIVVIRPQPEEATERIVLELEDVMYHGDPASNIVVEPGDMIYVPMEVLIKVYVNGAVGKPGAIDVKRSEPVTVLQAVTAAGGTTERAAERRVQIIRRTADGGKEIIPVDLKKIKQGRAEDILLQKDDVVFVPEAFF